MCGDIPHGGTDRTWFERQVQGLAHGAEREDYEINEMDEINENPIYLYIFRLFRPFRLFRNLSSFLAKPLTNSTIQAIQIL